MLFTALINDISADTSIKILSSQDIYDIKDIALIDGTCASYQNDILYFGYSGQLPSCKLPQQCVLADVPDTNAIDNLRGDIALVNPADLFRLFNAAKALIESGSSQRFYKELLDCAERSGSIQPIMNVAASKLGNSVILLDADFRVLAHSTVFPIDDPLWKLNIQQGYCNYEFVRAVYELDSVKNAPPNSDPVVVTCHASPRRKLSSKIFIQGKLAGMIVMLENETSIISLHMQLLPVISAATAVAIYRYTPCITAGYTNYEKLLYDLLIGAPPEEIAPQIRGLQFSPSMCALCIRPTRYLGQKHLKERVSDELLRRLPGTRLCYHEGGIAALVPLHKQGDIMSEKVEILEQLALSEYLQVGVSNAFFNPESFAKRYAQARRAMELGNKMHNEKPVFVYSDYSFYDLLDNAGTPESLGLFCRPALSILSRYDHDSGTDLYSTLEVYLQCDFSVKAAAEKLYIHRNTLSYRLEKIVDLTSVDLSDSNTRFLLAMSYRIDHFIGRDA